MFSDVICSPPPQNAIDYDLELKKYLEFEKNATQEIENEKAAVAAGEL